MWIIRPKLLACRCIRPHKIVDVEYLCPTAIATLVRQCNLQSALFLCQANSFTGYKTGRGVTIGKNDITSVLPKFGGYRSETISLKWHSITFGLVLLKFMVAPLCGQYGTEQDRMMIHLDETLTLHMYNVCN